MRFLVVIATLLVSACGLVDAFSSPTATDTGGPGRNGCSSPNAGGCSCTGTCTCDDAGGPGCHCHGQDCVIESQVPAGCGTLSLECVGVDCRCNPGDTIACDATQCTISDALTHNGVCNAEVGGGCSCNNGLCHCGDLSTACCTGSSARCN